MIRPDSTLYNRSLDMIITDLTHVLNVFFKLMPSGIYVRFAEYKTNERKFDFVPEL